MSTSPEQTPALADWQVKVRCKDCNTIFYSRYEGEFRTCACGNSFVDQTPYYGRYAGNLEDVKDSSDNDNNK